MNQPTPEEWQSLYAVAAAFHRLAPWQWMADADLVGVEDPVTRQVGYCSVLGAGGQEFGLVVFPGPEGFASYRRLGADASVAMGEEAGLLLRSISLLFVDRELLEPQDRAVIGALGLRFRGRGAWPWFRSQRPGYAPWFLEQEEARLVQLGLEQVIETAPRVLAGAVRLTSGAAGEPILTRSLGPEEWSDAWRSPAVWEAPQEEPPPVDALRVERLRRGKRRDQGYWELDAGLMPLPIADKGERPYYPRLLLAADEAGMIVGMKMLEPWSPAGDQQEALLALFGERPGLPREIRVGREEMRRLVAPVAEGLGITIRVTKLGLLDAFREELLNQAYSKIPFLGVNPLR